MLVPEETTILVSSDPAQGAINRSLDGSNFEIQLDDALAIPKDAINITLSCETATIWWTVPNIITGVNDTIYVFGDDDQAVPTPQLFTVVIPQGLYDLTGLNNAIQSGLEALGAKTVNGVDPLPLISLLADSSTQKVFIRFNYTNVYVDFAPADTMREILGFDGIQYGPFANAPVNELAPNVANFSTVEYFLIASDLVQKGIRFNNKYNQVISQVLIDVAPGSQIVNAPFNPARINAQELAGTRRTNLRFRLTDDQLRQVNTNGEFWTARIAIRYFRPYTVAK